MTIDPQPWVVAVVSVERRLAGAGRFPVVVGETGCWQQVDLVVLPVVAVDPKVLLQGLVRTFRLPVCLWVVGSRKVLPHPERLANGLGELGNESGAPIRYNGPGSAVASEDLLDESPRQDLGVPLFSVW